MLTIGFKELLLIAALIGGLIWMRMFRTTMDRKATEFMHKLKGPDAGTGFGWRGLLAAFVIGMVCCGGVVWIALRLWSYIHPASGG